MDRSAPWDSTNGVWQFGRTKSSVLQTLRGPSQSLASHSWVSWWGRMKIVMCWWIAGRARWAALFYRRGCESQVVIEIDDDLCHYTHGVLTWFWLTPGPGSLTLTFTRSGGILAQKLGQNSARNRALKNRVPSWRHWPWMAEINWRSLYWTAGVLISNLFTLNKAGFQDFGSHMCI